VLHWCVHLWWSVDNALQVKTDTSDFDSSLIFEQDPVQIIDALLPLYLNSTLLRALQESLACELAARMNAMSSASDNAKDLKKKLNLKYNRQRQAAITGQIIEICSGSSAWCRQKTGGLITSALGNEYCLPAETSAMLALHEIQYEVSSLLKTFETFFPFIIGLRSLLSFDFSVLLLWASVL